MRAAQITELGTPPQAADLQGAAGLEILAVALNPLDIAVGAGRFYGGHPPLPYVPGCEAAARTEDGRLVYLFGEGHGVSKDGFLAERVAVSDRVVLELPDGTDPATAAALGIAGVAAWGATAWKAKLGPGDRVLVLGASGVVGQLATQAARLLGAETVVGASRSGAANTVPFERIGDELGSEGFTVCIDPVWGDVLADALQYAAPRARIVHLGQSAGPEAPLKSADVRGKELTLQGHSNFVLTRDERDRCYLDLLEHVRAGRIELPLTTFPLDSVAEAWQRQAAGAHEKVVVIP
jgi:NADPH2:quinone reductase